MTSGLACGADPRPGLAPVLGLFRDDEGGFTTVAVAVSLILSLSLVFAAASATWVAGRSSEVQRVADACALAGENTVAAFSTVVQVVDACVLSMGLAGVIVLGAGLVVSCVPGLSAAGAEVTSAGGRILEARRSFAESAGEGIERLEATLPLLIVANSASCVEANEAGGVSYTGCAIPFPTESRSDFSALEADVDEDELVELSDQMREVSDEVDEAQRRAEEAKERAWRADCVTEPYCLRERAASLAGLGVGENPHYPTVDAWTFGVPLLRARAYYAARLASAHVGGSGAEEITDSACRRAFYEYALEEVRSGSYEEHADGTVSVDLPSLPRNADQTRGTRLYTDAVWPCTVEGGRANAALVHALPGRRGSSVRERVARGRRGGVCCHVRPVPHGHWGHGARRLGVDVHSQRVRAPLAHHRRGVEGLRGGAAGRGGGGGAAAGARGAGRGRVRACARGALRRPAHALPSRRMGVRRRGRALGLERPLGADRLVPLVRGASRWRRRVRRGARPG